MVKYYETKYDKLEVCRNCHGKRRVFHKPANDIDLIGKWEPCPVCEGKGIVKKHYYVEITVQPIKEEE